MRTRRVLALVAGLACIVVLAADAAAMYHPTLGRWLSRDPAERVERGGLYGYAAANPTRLVDPDGRYGRETHLEATQVLSLQAMERALRARGLAAWVSAQQALRCVLHALDIASANQGADEGGNDAASAVVAGRERGTAQYDVHFPGAGFPEPFGQQTPVVGGLGNPAVSGRLRGAIGNCDTHAMGVALHSLQDSYAHEGVPDMGGHPRGRPLFDPNDDGVPQGPLRGIFGEQQQSGGLLDARVDDPAYDRARYGAALFDTRFMLITFWYECVCRLCI